MSPKTVQLSPVDSAWLHMEHPTNLMMITGVMLFKQPLDFARVRETYRVRLLQFRRFRQRVAEATLGLGMPHWEDDPHFTLDAHIHHIALPAPGNRDQLTELLSDLASTPLDFTKPLWQVHLIDNVDGGSVLVTRLHHCIGDGTALVAVTHALLDDRPDAPLEPTLPPQPHRPRRSMSGQVAHQIASVFQGAQSAMGAIWHESVASLLHPSHMLELTQAAGRSATRGAAVVGRALVQSDDPHTPLKGRLGVQKRVAWTEAVATDETRRIAHALGCKINDVLVAAMTGALRGYLLERSADACAADIRAIIPMDLRPPERALELGNVFGLVFLSMPITLADPLERLSAVKQRMDALKHSDEALLYFGLLNIFGMTPKQIEENVVEFFATKATTVFTNVVGPRTPLYIAGAQVDNMVFWVPQSGRLSMGISIYSYNNQITMGVITDAGLAPDPERITAGFNAEYRVLQRAADLRAQEDEAHRARRQCTALTRSGSPCRNSARSGAAYCALHARTAQLPPQAAPPNHPAPVAETFRAPVDTAPATA